MRALTGWGSILETVPTDHHLAAARSAVALVQASSSFVWLFLRNPERGVLTLAASIGVVYGTGWLLPAFLISDFGLIRPRLSRPELRNLASIAAGIAAIVGLIIPGMLVMIGYPVTAAAILLVAFVHRHRKTVGKPHPARVTPFK